MHDTTIRLAAVTLDHFKAVGHGELRWDTAKARPCCVLGLFGPNGSGKTSLLEAIGLLKALLSHQSLAENIGDCIRFESDAARLAFELHLYSPDNEEAPVNVFYEFQIRRSVEGGPALVTNEKFSAVLPIAGGRHRRLTLIDTSCGDPFAPVEKVKQLAGAGADIRQMLAKSKQEAQRERRTFIFSDALQQRIEATLKNHDHGDLCYTVLSLLERLRRWAETQVFISTADGNTLHLGAFFHEKTPLLPINHVFPLPFESLDVADRALERLNGVLREVSPTLGLRLVRKPPLADQTPSVVKVELHSEVCGRLLPLRLESSGIRQLVTRLPLLVTVFNDSSATAVLDDLDASLFEPLMGELLRIVSTRGKGQLLFAAHDLRPLETMDKTFVTFSTADPENRFLRFKNIKSTNNLRDVYYRELMLGDLSETLCHQGHNAKIALAMRDAGHAP